MHPVAFYSRKLSPAEQNYTTHDKELLAIVVALTHWRQYLARAAHQIQVYSDYKNLVYFQTMRTLTPRHACWALLLVDYDFVIVYIPGQLNPVADALSRREDYFPLKENKANCLSNILLPLEKFKLCSVKPYAIDPGKSHCTYHGLQS